MAIGVYTINEPSAYHLQFCQEWIKLEGNSNKESFLNANQILDICKKHNIDALHPGYGFLSENAGFAELLRANGVLWIGPNPKAIDAMGDKAKSKKLAAQCHVPVVPGSIGSVPTVIEAKKIANEIGYPVLLKAVAGGGGKGMRVCENNEEIEKNFSAVQRESLSSFGNDELLVEKYVKNPHHIEVQILGDKKGNCFHLFERECSVQRRHQKIIEEAPSPFIGEDVKLREELCQAAVRLAKAVQYDSAGTVEFIMGEDRKFYFLEMNTRIQVEHPITEEITGVDLVSNMIKAAFEEPLDIQSQNDIKIQGHSMETRICAEDPIDMLPAPGKISAFHQILPTQSRFDHCIYAGLEIKPDFDPMIGKLIVRGINRRVSIRKMKMALEELEIQGIKSNIPLLKWILREKNFVDGHYDTHYLNHQKSNIESDLKMNLSLKKENLSQVESEILGIIVSKYIN